MLITLWWNGPIKYHRWFDINLVPPTGKLLTASERASEASASLNEATRCLHNDWWLIKCRRSDEKWRLSPQRKRPQFQGYISNDMWHSSIDKKKMAGCTNCLHFAADKSRVEATGASFYTHPPDSITSLHLICYSITEVRNLITEGDADASYHPTGRSNYSAGRLSWSTIPEWDVCLIITESENVLSWKKRKANIKGEKKSKEAQRKTLETLEHERLRLNWRRRRWQREGRVELPWKQRRRKMAIWCQMKEIAQRWVFFSGAETKLRKEKTMQLKRQTTSSDEDQRRWHIKIPQQKQGQTL